MKLQISNLPHYPRRAPRPPADCPPGRGAQGNKNHLRATAAAVPAERYVDLLKLEAYLAEVLVGRSDWNHVADLRRSILGFAGVDPGASPEETDKALADARLEERTLTRRLGQIRADARLDRGPWPNSPGLQEVTLHRIANDIRRGEYRLRLYDHVDRPEMGFYDGDRTEPDWSHGDTALAIVAGAALVVTYPVFVLARRLLRR